MNTIPSLYRTYLRQVRALPHVYLRHFFRIKGADDFRSLLEANSVHLRKKKLKRVSRDLQRLRAANAGESAAFDRMLDIAYGRVGKLRWELMEPFLSPDAPLLPQVDPQKGKIPSPVYSPELAALLTSCISRTTRVLQKQHLDSPPGLPRRAQSNSEDAMLLGSLSKRREHNVRWSFFRSEWKKVYPPLQISTQHPADDPSAAPSSDNSGRDFQNVLVLQELLTLAGSPSRSPDPTSKQRRLQRIQKMTHTNTNPFDGNLPLRWLRRRYQALLGRLPLLVSRPSQQDNSKRVYNIQIAHDAMATSRMHPSRLRIVDAEEAVWISDAHLTARSAGRRGT